MARWCLYRRRDILRSFWDTNLSPDEGLGLAKRLASGRRFRLSGKALILPGAAVVSQAFQQESTQRDRVVVFDVVSAKDQS